MGFDHVVLTLHVQLYPCFDGVNLLLRVCIVICACVKRTHDHVKPHNIARPTLLIQDGYCSIIYIYISTRLRPTS